MKATSERTQAVWPLRVAAALLCMVLASSYLLSGLYARYTTAATGTDSARVAVFDITQTPASDSQEFAVDAMAPGLSRTYTVSVTNKSEVAVECRMDVRNVTENLPLTWSMTENGTAVEAGQIPAGDSTARTYTLTVTWPKGASGATTNNQSADYMGKVDLLRLSLSASQID